MSSKKNQKVARGAGVILDPALATPEKNEVKKEEEKPDKKFQCRRWCFTAYPNKHTLLFNEEWMNYMIYQWEITPTTGELHQQGYFETKKKITYGGLKKLLHKSIHYEHSKGTQTEAIDYCKDTSKKEKVIKNGFGDRITSACYKYIESGKKIKVGERTDIAGYVQKIKEGAKEKDLADDESTVDIWARYPGIYKRYKQLENASKPKPWPMVIVIVGAPGVGKSRTAHLIAKNLGSYYVMTGNYRWWEDYNNETSIIMDDYEGQLQTKDLLQLWDRYKCKREVKGGTVYITSENFIVTCNSIDWINHDAIKRRIAKIWYV